jgi:nitroreductase
MFSRPRHEEPNVFHNNSSDPQIGKKVAMEFYEVIEARHSVRAFAENVISMATLEHILAAARRSPSASNKLPWRLVVVSDKHKRELFAKSGTYGKFLAQSPIALVGVADPTVAPKWYAVDTAIALEHVVLAATAEGLGSCWVGSFDEATVKELIGAPESLKVVAIIALGYQRKATDALGAANGLIRPTKSLDELVCWENFSSPWSQHHD